MKNITESNKQRKKTKKRKFKRRTKRQEKNGLGSDEEYEVDAILDRKENRHGSNKYDYLVKWKAHDGPNSWFPESNLENSQILKNKFDNCYNKKK